MHGIAARCGSRCFSAVSIGRLAGAGLAAFGDEGGEAGIAGRPARRPADGRATSATNEAPNSVSGRVVKTSSCRVARGRRARRTTRAPSERADPVLLHQAHLRRASGRASSRPRQQLLGEGGDPEEPLRQLAPLDQRAGAPAAAVDHLLVGQHGVVDRIPVDPGFLAVGEAGLQKVEEHLLLVAVVARDRRSRSRGPVERQAHRFSCAAMVAMFS